MVSPKVRSLRVGGHRVLTDTGGAYLEPTVVTGAAADNPIVREEIFGPVLAVQVVNDEAEAMRVAGDTPYGLAAALWTVRSRNSASGVTCPAGGDRLGQLL